MATQISSLFDELDAICQRIVEIEWKDQDIARKRKASSRLRKLSDDLEETGDLCDRIIYQPLDNVLLRIALDLDIFKILVEHTGLPLDTVTLANKLNVDHSLMRRIMRALNAMGAVGQVGPNTFVPTKFSRAFATQKGVAGTKFLYEFAAIAWNKLPAYLANTQYRDPSDPNNTAVQLAFNSEKHCFDIMKERPEALKALATLMTVKRDGRPNFTDFFPVENQLAEGFHQHDKDAIMFVDVGGGRGHEVLELRRRFPGMQGRMILQDRPEVIRTIHETDGMEVMEYDFFKPQPAKGARAYYFRNVLHDWNNNNAVFILRQTTAAMTPGYSKLLINELVLPNENASLFMTRLDFNMMALLAALERSEDEWRELLGSVGLRIIKIWLAEGEGERIIECILE